MIYTFLFEILKITEMVLLYDQYILLGQLDYIHKRGKQMTHCVFKLSIVFSIIYSDPSFNFWKEMRQAILCKYYKQGKGHLMKAHSWLLTITVNNNNKIASFPAKAVFGGKRVIAVDNFITFTGKLCLSRVSLHF